MAARMRRPPQPQRRLPRPSQQLSRASCEACRNPDGHAAAVPAPTAPGNAVFPNAVSPKYSSESAGKARMHTCLDQYNANKTNNATAALVWIKKGGGYNSECNKHLKG